MSLSKPLTLLLLLVLTGCNSKTPVASSPVPVQVTPVTPLEDGSALRYSAEVTPAVQVDVAFRTEGYVTAITEIAANSGSNRALQPGDSVTQGAELARIEEQQYRDGLQQAEASLASANAALRKGSQDHKRANALYQTQSITGADYDSAVQELASAQAAVANAKAQVDEAQIKLHNTRLMAPFSGIIIARYIDIGSLVHSGTAGFALADLSQVKVLFGVPDVVVQSIALGSTQNIATATLPDSTLSGSVTEIAPSANPRTRVFDVTVTVDNPDGTLKPGMIATLQIDQSLLTATLLVIPISAVVAAPNGEGFGAYVVESDDQGNSVARHRAIKVGQVLGNRIAVNAGLSLGDQVITVGTGQISNNQSVSLIR